MWLFSLKPMWAMHLKHWCKIKVLIHLLVFVCINFDIHWISLLLNNKQVLQWLTLPILCCNHQRMLTVSASRQLEIYSALPNSCAQQTVFWIMLCSIYMHQWERCVHTSPSITLKAAKNEYWKMNSCVYIFMLIILAVKDFTAASILCALFHCFHY